MQYVIKEENRVSEYLVTELNAVSLKVLCDSISRDYHWLDSESWIQEPKLAILIRKVLSGDESALQELMTIDPKDCLLIDGSLINKVTIQLQTLKESGEGLAEAIRLTKRLVASMELAEEITESCLTRIRLCITSVLQDTKVIDDSNKKDTEPTIK